MSKFSIQNITLGGITLPPPYDVILPPGKGIIVEDSEDNILRNLGGPDAILGTLRLQQVPEGNLSTVFSGIQFPFDTNIREIVITNDGDDHLGNGTASGPYQTIQRGLAKAGADPVLPPGASYMLNAVGLSGVESLPVDYQMPTIQATHWVSSFATNPYLFDRALTIKTSLKLTATVPASDAIITFAQAPTRTPHAGSNLVIITVVGVRPSWAAGAMKSKKFTRTIGTANTTCAIYDSDDDDGGGNAVLYICNRIGAVPALVPGAEFRIMEPSVILEAPPSTGNDGGAIRCINMNALAFQGLGFRCSVPGADVGLSVEGCPQPLFEACDFPDGFAVSGADFQFAPFSCSVGGTLLAAGGTFTPRRSFFKDLVTLDSTVLQTDYFNSVLEGCPTITNGVLDPTAGSGPLQQSWAMTNGRIRGATGVAVNPASGRWQLKKVQIDDAAGNGISVEGDAFVVLDAVSGSGNTGYGVEVIDGAKVRSTDETTTTITGAGGAVKCGSLPVAAHAPGISQIDLTYDPTGAAPAQVTGTGSFYFERA